MQVCIAECMSSADSLLQTILYIAYMLPLPLLWSASAVHDGMAK